MLTGAGLGDYPLFAHAAGKQGLPHGVVDLVRTGVVEVFALEVDLGTTEFFGPPAGVIDRTGPTDKMFQFAFEFGHELRVLTIVIVGRTQLVERTDQGLGDEDSAIRAKMAAGVGKIVGFHGCFNGWVGGVVVSRWEALTRATSARRTASTKACIRAPSLQRGSAP